MLACRVKNRDKKAQAQFFLVFLLAPFTASQPALLFGGLNGLDTAISYQWCGGNRGRGCLIIQYEYPIFGITG